MLLRQGFSVPKKDVDTAVHETRKISIMSKNNSNVPSLDKYLQSVKDRGYDNLLMPTHKETIAELVSEGNKLLELEVKNPSKKPTVKSSLENSLAATDSNPYIRARAQILKAMPAWRQQEIEEMESKGNTNNRFYEDFVKNVTDLGNQLSSK